MELTITPKSSTFRHPGELSAQFDTYDPREGAFRAESVRVDLSGCEFVRPPAVMWCVVFLSLSRSRGAECSLVVPKNFGVCVHLKAIGCFDLLKKCGVNVDDRGLPNKQSQEVIVPIQRFETVQDATRVTNDADVALQASDALPVGITPIVAELMSELALNAAQHSESEIGAFAFTNLLRFRKGNRIVVAVADGGIGVLAGLRKNMKLHSRVNYDWDALELSVRERVSGTGDPHRGIGLYGVSEDIRKPGHSMLLHSGLGSLEIRKDMQSSARRTRLFPGTLAYLSIQV